MYYGCNDDFVGSYFDELKYDAEQLLVDTETNRAAVERGVQMARERREARRRRLGFVPRVSWADGAATSFSGGGDCCCEKGEEEDDCCHVAVRIAPRRRRCECMCCNGCGKNNGGCREFGGLVCAACDEWRCATCMAPPPPPPPAMDEEGEDAAAAAALHTSAQTTCRYCLRML